MIDTYRYNWDHPWLVDQPRINHDHMDHGRLAFPSQRWSKMEKNNVKANQVGKSQDAKVRIKKYNN